LRLSKNNSKAYIPIIYALRFLAERQKTSYRREKSVWLNRGLYTFPPLTRHTPGFDIVF